MTPTRHRTPGKHDFSPLYNRPDPRAYYQALRPLDYCLPAFACLIFLRCAEWLARLRDKPGIKVVDLCCGYGVNGALLRHEVELDELYSRYDDPEHTATPHETLRGHDRKFFAEREQDSPIDEIVGVDIADRALDYAEDVGLIDTGVAVDLEKDSLPDDLREHLADADLITVTGGIGYLSKNTIRRIYEATAEDARPWFAGFPLRTTRFDSFETELDRFELETEIWQGSSFPQRQFTDEAEEKAIRHELTLVDADPANEVTDGYLHAELRISRPPGDIERVPLARLVPSPSAPAGKPPFAGTACPKRATPTVTAEQERAA